MPPPSGLEGPALQAALFDTQVPTMTTDVAMGSALTSGERASKVRKLEELKDRPLDDVIAEETEAIVLSAIGDTLPASVMAKLKELHDKLDNDLAKLLQCRQQSEKLESDIGKTSILALINFFGFNI